MDYEDADSIDSEIHSECKDVLGELKDAEDVPIRTMKDDKMEDGDIPEEEVEKKSYEKEYEEDEDEGEVGEEESIAEEISVPVKF